MRPSNPPRTRYSTAYRLLSSASSSSWLRPSTDMVGPRRYGLMLQTSSAGTADQSKGHRASATSARRQVRGGAAGWDVSATALPFPGERKSSLAWRYPRNSRRRVSNTKQLTRSDPTPRWLRPLRRVYLATRSVVVSRRTRAAFATDHTSGPNSQPPGQHAG